MTEKSNYEKISEYFDSSKVYSKKEVIDALIELGIAPSGKGLLNKLKQESSFRKTRGKQIDESVMMIRFRKSSKHNKLYRLDSWINYF